MKKFFLILWVICLAWGCNKENANDGYGSSNGDNDSNSSNGAWITQKTGNYMDAFFRPKKFELRLVDSIYDVQLTKAEFHVFYDLEDEYNYSQSTSIQDKAHLAKYNEYAKYYGDTTYTWFHTMSVIEEGCLAPLESITIVANKDFDDNHPAGTLLNDLFELQFYAFHSFIKDGYKNVFEKNENLASNPIDSVVIVSDFKCVSLLQKQAVFNLIKRPAKGKYTFTFTLNFGEDPLTGEKVEVPPASIEVEF